MGLIVKYKNLLFLLLGAFVFRLILSFFGVHPDIFSQANWGSWIYENGPVGFYQNNHWIYEWPNQPPLVNLIYASSLNLHGFFRGLLSNIGLFIAVNHLGANHLLFYYDFVKWFGTARIPPTDIYYGQVIIIKWIAIITDILIAFFFYWTLREKLQPKKSLLLTGLFLLLPFSWYLTSFWGQYDQMALLFFFISLILLSKRFFVLSAAILILGFQIKQTVIFYFPFFMAFFLLQKPGIKKTLLSLFTGLAIILVLTLPFVNINNFWQESWTLYRGNFLGRSSFITNHAFNFWGIFFPEPKAAKFPDLLFLAGAFFILLVNLAAVFILKKDRALKSLLSAAYIVTAGTFIFGPGMLDRYFYPAAIFLGLNIAFFPKLFWPWVLTCLLYSFNLLYSWGYPFWDYGWNNQSLIRILSLAQVVLFFTCLNIIFGKWYRKFMPLKS